MYMPPAENNETPKYNLPPAHEVGAELNSSKEENQPASPEISGKLKTPKAGSSKTQIADFHLKDLSASEPATSTASSVSDDNPQIADDNDLIEKEWVAKAKKIIEKNREDPKAQSDEMTLFKADYIKKRYNKVIKVNE